MKPLFFSLFFAFLTGMSAQAQNQVLLISDIDDTLKISNVQDLADSAQNTVLIHNHFLGMSEIYNTLGPQEGIRFFYVSNAIQRMMSVLHDSFLNFNLFPAGPAFLRPSVFETDHKLQTVSNLIRKYQPSRVVLIGDNGEKDPQIYAQVQSRFPQMKMDVFIHQVYSVRSSQKKGMALQPGQVGYATSVDLGFHLVSRGYANDSDYLQFVEEMVPRILNEPNHLMSGEAAFPAWMDCRDAVFPNYNPDHRLLSAYLKKAQARCSLPGFQ